MMIVMDMMMKCRLTVRTLIELDADDDDGDDDGGCDDDGGGD